MLAFLLASASRIDHMCSSDIKSQGSRQLPAAMQAAGRSNRGEVESSGKHVTVIICIWISTEPDGNLMATTGVSHLFLSAQPCLSAAPARKGIVESGRCSPSEFLTPAWVAPQAPSLNRDQAQGLNRFSPLQQPMIRRPPGLPSGVVCSDSSLDTSIRIVASQ